MAKGEGASGGLRVALVAPAVMPINEQTEYGGAELVVKCLGEELANLGHAVTVFAPKGSKVKGCEVFETVDCGPEKAWGKEKEAFWRWKDELGDFDVVHSHEHSGLVYAAQQLLGKPLPILHTAHGLIQESVRIPWWDKPCVVALSEHHGWHTQKKYGYASEIVYNGIDTKFYNAEGSPRSASYPEERRLYLSFGLMAAHKGHVEAIEAAAAAGVHLIVAGEDRFVAEPGYVKDVKALCVDHDFQYDGSVSAERKRSLFRKADGVICWYSELEACPVTVLEAVACGAYVLGSTRGPMPELIDPLWGRCCKDVEELKAAMEEPNIQSTGAQDVFNERFGERAMAEAYIALYEGVVASERW